MRTLCSNPTARLKPLPLKRGSTVVGAVREPPLQVTREKLPSGTKARNSGVHKSDKKSFAAGESKRELLKIERTMRECY